MKITAESVLAFAPHAAIRGVGTGGVVLDTKSGLIYASNETAQDFLSRLDGTRSVAEISREMAAEYDVAEAELCADMTELMDDLATEGLVRAA